MSALVPSVKVVNPWTAIAADPSIKVVFVKLPPGLLGFCDTGMRTIWIQKGLRQRQRRAVIEHERIHLERNGVCAHWQDKEERAVEEATARALMPLPDLLDAIRWSRDLYDLADDLHVPVDLVALRFQTMRHPAERAAVAAVMADLAEMGVA